MRASKPVHIRPAADADLDNAIAYLLVQRPSSAAELLDCFEKAVEQLGRFPQSGSPRLGQWINLPALRSMVLRGFPFLLFYIERDDHLEVVRLLHASRDLPAILADDLARPDDA